MTLAGKHILLGISGGIAAYKAPMLVRLLTQAGAEVLPVLTEAAEQFVTPITLGAVSTHTPRRALFDLDAESAMGHIELARWADMVLIAPATANLLAKLAKGQADDLLTTLCLATPAPVVVAPAMNQAMWRHPATQANVVTLQSRGVRVLGPASGDQACGDDGPGRMEEPETLFAACHAHFVQSSALAGCRVVVTAGPTREAIDPVRFISNHSSGRQGYAIAQAARSAGAEVVLVSGPCKEAVPAGVQHVPVESAREMQQAVMAELNETDIFVGVAAVADYRVAEVETRKIKREKSKGLQLELIANPDIIAGVASAPNRPKLVIGFAAETHDLLQHARGKLARKGLDAIVVNNVADPSIGFNSTENAATIITQEDEIVLERQPKSELARQLVNFLAQRLQAKASTVS